MKLKRIRKRTNRIEHAFDLWYNMGVIKIVSGECNVLGLANGEFQRVLSASSEDGAFLMAWRKE